MGGRGNRRSFTDIVESQLSRVEPLIPEDSDIEQYLEEHVPQEAYQEIAVEQGHDFGARNPADISFSGNEARQARDIVEEEINNSISTYFDAVSGEEAQQYFEDWTLKTLEEFDSGGLSKGNAAVFVENFLEAAVSVATDILAERGEPVDEPEDTIHHGKGVGRCGAMYDWQNDAIHVGRHPDNLSFEPRILPILAHELRHKRQFEDRITEAVETYNDLVSASSLPMKQIDAETEEQYYSYGLMMIDDADTVRTLFRHADQEYQAATTSETRQHVTEYLSAAIQEEAEKRWYAPGTVEHADNPEAYPTTDDIYTTQDEIDAQVLYLQQDGIVNDEERLTAFFAEVVSSYEDAAMIEDGIRDELSA